MSISEDRISKLRFQSLVDKCNNKQEILDLCEKALKKYRPLVMSKESPVFTLPNTTLLTCRETIGSSRLYQIGVVDYKVRQDYERLTRQTINSKIMYEIEKGNYIKYDDFYDARLDEQVFLGSIKVVTK